MKVELILDDNFSAVMARAAKVTFINSERIREQRYQLRIDAQRLRAHAHLNKLLDQWCTSYGWEPTKVWRTPRALENLDRLKAASR
ncbi:hypothetical protein EFK50_01210 [Nocardioides marmoriginsengisoli]|uniref:Uncharacterized protein n=1 Tax=Nocardioides marmoriginsengisoli TaxID=661483 RepID=A0A3N0CS55_9ACTN|nr:hypothetical protein [Nocardioides marmoriginsengisoli]RNL66275.1 hypothetical protein EFK50_01210 [Nocardioides marmoriginsengisoli]